ncbi:MAG TPA: lipoyl synthase [bacterium]|nr:lipoyl synthase [bacterium]HPN31826.1 lipoyl synthase [bacterium]
MKTDEINNEQNYLRKPEWLKKKIRFADQGVILKKKTISMNLNTVCKSALCPNIYECFNNKTATFMILGDICSRRCKFCNVKKGTPRKFDFEDEINNIVKFAIEYQYKYLTITSVTRDDLKDMGTNHFIKLTRALLEAGIKSELLLPDLNGNTELLKKIIESGAVVINHNIEMIEKLYADIRPDSNFKTSMRIIENIKKIDDSIISKTGFMVGFGETESEILNLIDLLAETGVDILTIGQYLQPSLQHYPVKEYIEESKFSDYKIYAKKKIKVVESGPFVRSSYKSFESYLNLKKSAI